MPIYAGPLAYEVPADAPPLFVAVAIDDRELMTTTATGLLNKWKKAGRSAELHVFPDGGHGFGMNKRGFSCDVWTDLMEAWMKRQGLIGGS